MAYRLVFAQSSASYDASRAQIDGLSETPAAAGNPKMRLHQSDEYVKGARAALWNERTLPVNSPTNLVEHVSSSNELFADLIAGFNMAGTDAVGTRSSTAFPRFESYRRINQPRPEGARSCARLEGRPQATPSQRPSFETALRACSRMRSVGLSSIRPIRLVSWNRSTRSLSE
jgi:hypothetical protein